MGSGRNTYTINSSIAQLDINQGWEEFFNEDTRFRAALDARFPKGVPIARRTSAGYVPEDVEAHEATIAEKDANGRSSVDRAEHPHLGRRAMGEITIDDPYYAGQCPDASATSLRTPHRSSGTKFGKAMNEYFRRPRAKAASGSG